MNSSIGTTFREIRKNKRFSQYFISNKIITQSSYSKFELGKIELTYSSYSKLLEKIEMPHDEFVFINNGYQYSLYERIIKNFFNSTYNSPLKLNLIINDCNTLLIQKENLIVSDILLTCKALLLLSENKDIELVRNEVKKVWKRVAEYDNWYLTEIKILNAVLYLFPTQEATEISNIMLNNLKKYKDFQDIYKLEINIKLNLSLLQMREKNFALALQILDKVISSSKTYSMYKQLATANIRKGICLMAESKADSKEFIDKGFLMLELIEDDILISFLEQELEEYALNG